MSSNLKIIQDNYSKKIKNNLTGPCNPFIWTCHFEHTKYFNTFNEQTIFIEDCDGAKVDCHLKIDKASKIIQLYPKKPYQKNQYYYLNLQYSTKRVPIYIAFKIESEGVNPIRFKTQKQRDEFRKKEKMLHQMNNSPTVNTFNMNDTQATTKANYQLPVLEKEKVFINILPFVLSIVCLTISAFVSSALVEIIFVITGLILLFINIIIAFIFVSSEQYKAVKLYNVGVGLFNMREVNEALTYFEEANKLLPDAINIKYARKLCFDYLYSGKSSI